jgi:hypothetical protein
MAEEIEETFEEPVSKLPITASLEPIKTKFFAGDNNSFNSELKNGKFKVFETEYKYNDEFDGRPEFFVKNLINGFTKQLEDTRKYLFVAFKCFKTNGGYIVKAIWICNCTLPMEEVISDKYNDFTWNQLDMTIENDVLKVENHFKKDDCAQDVLIVTYLH